MTILVRGIRVARAAARLLEQSSASLAEVYRGSKNERTYWVHCPGASAAVEQLILSRLPCGSLVRVEEATYKPRPTDAVDWQVAA